MDKSLISVFRLSIALTLLILILAAASQWMVTKSTSKNNQIKYQERVEFINATHNLERLRDLAQKINTTQNAGTGVIISTFTLIRNVALVLGFIACAICFLSYKAHKIFLTSTSKMIRRVDVPHILSERYVQNK